MRRTMKRTLVIASLFALVSCVGYVLSSNFAGESLRQEAEIQLTRLMEGRTSIESARLRLGRGLILVGEGVEIYPDGGQARLAGRRVSARIDLIALLTGRFRLRALRLEGVHFEIERDAGDAWSPTPIAALDTRGEGKDPADLERKLDLLRAFESVTRALLERPRVAPLIELEAGSIRLTDHYVQGEGMPPLELRIEKIRGRLEFGWLDDRARLELRGELIDANGRAAPVHIDGRRRSGARLQLEVTANAFELENVRPYFQPQDPASRDERAIGVETRRNTRPLSGLLNATLHYQTLESGHGFAEVELSANDFVAAMNWGEEHLDLSTPVAGSRVVLELLPNRVRLERGEFRGETVRMEISGRIDRPLRDSSLSHFSLDLYGAGLEEWRRVANALPRSNQTPMLSFLDQVESGTITRLGGRGETNFATWRRIFRGEILELPPGLVTSAQLSDIQLRSRDGEDVFSDISGTVEWTENRIALQEARFRWNDREMPRLDVMLEGFPHLLEDRYAGPLRRSQAGPIPGLARIGDIFLAGDGHESEDATALPPIEVEIDQLEHPTLHWPIHDARVRLDSRPGGVGIQIHRGQWGQASVTGDVTWSYEPEWRVEARVWLGDGEIGALEQARQAVSALPEDGEPSSRWGEGRFFVDQIESERFPVQSMLGGWALDGSELQILEFQAPLTPKGKLESNLRLGLSESEFLSIQLSASVRDGDADRVAHALGLPEGLVNGTISLDGEFDGTLRPGAPLLSEIDGALEIDAREGLIRARIPLIAAVTHMSEGLNPVEAGKTIRFQSIDAHLDFDQGRISTDEFRLDGPLRIFVTGNFDVARPGNEIHSEMGFFLFRQVDIILGRLPLIQFLIPGGSEKGLFGAYFEVTGTLEQPEFDALALRTLTQGILMPDLIKGPFAAIRDAMRSDPKRRERARDTEYDAPARLDQTKPLADGDPAQ